MADNTKKSEKPWEITKASPLERKLVLGVTVGSIVLAGAIMGFAAGAHYGKYLYQPTSIMEVKLNDDQYTDLSISDRKLNRTKYLGTPGGEYRRMER